MLKTRSTPGGGSFNELRIEDRAGAEQIYIHAQRDQDMELGHCESHSVGVDYTHSVGQNETVAIGQNRLRVVRVDDRTLVGGSASGSVAGSYLIEAGQGIRPITPMTSVATWPVSPTPWARPLA